MSVLDTFSLKGKTALMTGGAGLYGRQIAAALAEAGAQTIMASRNVDALEQAARPMRDAGGEVSCYAFDQGDEASILALRDQVIDKFGRVDVLVNNAVLRPLKDAFQSSAEAFDLSMRVNATGLFVITRAFGDEMAKQQSGSIINIGSIQGMVGPDDTLYRDTKMSGFYPDYFFHKGGMLNFTRFIAAYYGPQGVRCNCLAPGGFQTRDHPPQFVEKYSDRTFLGRMANDSDMQGAIVFLASDASVYITGANIAVDGGYTAK
jgi:NAD(P)-dependent dehydrogenase (short-subunit alcohol dehydrogenase family)